MEFIFVFVVFLIAISGFILSLRFSKYKRGDSGCCGGEQCDSEESTGGSCYSEKIKFVNKYNSGD